MKALRLSILVFLLAIASLAASVPASAQDLPTCFKPYKVVRGDSLSRIASRCGLTLSALLMANPQVQQPNRILPGQILYFPRKAVPVDDRSTTIVVRPAEDRLSRREIERLGIDPDGQERWIDVDLSSQTVSAYEGGVVIHTFLVSTGTWKHPTVTGQYRINQRYEADDMRGPGYFLKNVPYAQYFYRSYSLHGTYWHSNFGTPMSHGCINLATEDAEWLYGFAGLDTLVNIHY